MLRYLDLYVCVAVNCTEGALRLAGTLLQYAHYGRMEVCIQNQWRSICGDTWTEHGAAVACKELGYSEHGNAKCACMNSGDTGCPCNAIEYRINPLCPKTLI